MYCPNSKPDKRKLLTQDFNNMTDLKRIVRMNTGILGRRPVLQILTLFYFYSWFARDVTKNQTKKLSILLGFYFHEVLQYLNTFT